MISENTVFILGAGASKPYGFPLGVELIDEIISFLMNKTHRDILIHYGSYTGLIDPRSPEDFLEALINANSSSIDDFLTLNSENYSFQFIGKLSILFCIGKYEDPMRFKPKKDIQNSNNYSIDRDWYSIIWRRLYEGTKQINDLIENKVTFITFNYDRSLEYFFKSSIAGLYGTQNGLEKCEEVLSKIPIYHIYGKIGELSGDENSHQFKKYDQNAISFWPELLRPENKMMLESHFKRLKPLIDGLYVYSEKEYDPAVFKNTTNALQNSTKLYFFGFGFHPQNLKILFPRSFKANTLAEFYGTCLGLDSVAYRKTRSVLCHSYSTGPTAIHLESDTIINFLNSQGI